MEQIGTLRDTRNTLPGTSGGIRPPPVPSVDPPRGEEETSIRRARDARPVGIGGMSRKNGLAPLASWNPRIAKAPGLARSTEVGGRQGARGGRSPPQEAQGWRHEVLYAHDVFRHAQ